MEKTESVWEYAQKNPEGFTINIETLKPVKFGICVAHRETQDHHGKRSLQDVIEHAENNDKAVGGWLDYQTGKFYFDSVRIFKNKDLEQAVRFAKENEQIAIFDLTNLREIRI